MISFTMLTSGEERAWEILKDLEPTNVCKNASVSFDNNGSYIFRSFCSDFSINPREKTITHLSTNGEFIIGKYGYFFIHSCLWYLINAKDFPLTGKLIKPETIKGGDLFFKGTHVLPLDRLAEQYAYDSHAFIKRGRELCAEVLDYGDASIQLLPLPRIPVTVILWLRDEEFPPRADLLLDSSIEFQLPLDIIWSIAMLGVLVMM